MAGTVSQPLGVGTGPKDKLFFTSGAAWEAKSRGLRVVWSNEMMFPFKGEAEAVKEGFERVRNAKVSRYTKPIRRRWKAWTR